MFELLKSKHPELSVDPESMGKKTEEFAHSDIAIIPREIKLKNRN